MGVLGFLYTGISVGNSYFPDTSNARVFITDPEAGTFNEKISDSDAAYNFYLGYSFLENISLELGYIDFGKYAEFATARRFAVQQDVKIEESLNAYTLSLKARKQISMKFTSFFKVGISDWHSKSKFSNEEFYFTTGENYSYLASTAADSGSDLHIGFGFELINMVLELGRQELNDSEVNFIMVGMKF